MTCVLLASNVPGGQDAKAFRRSSSPMPERSMTRDIALACGRKGAGQPERFEAAGLEALPCERIGAVRIAQAVSWIECELLDMPVYGDHQLFVGRTLIAQTAGGAPLLMEGRSAFGRFEADEA